MANNNVAILVREEFLKVFDSKFNFLLMRKVLFITYDGLLDPLGRSQILPYIIGLSKKRIGFSVLSFEKKHSSYEIDKLKKLLKSFNISWYYLKFKEENFKE